MTTIPTATENDLLAVIVADYQARYKQPGDVTTDDIIEKTGVSYDQANGILNDYLAAHPGDVEKVKVIVPGRKGLAVAIRKCK